MTWSTIIKVEFYYIHYPYIHGWYSIIKAEFTTNIIFEQVAQCCLFYC